MKGDFVSLLREQERLLGLMCDQARGWMDDVLCDTFNPESFLRYAAGMGFDPSHIPNLAGKQSGFDPYRVLGLEKTATDMEVKKRYRKLLHVLHPDTADTKGTDFLCQKITEAYQQIEKERGWQ
jgi:DnaJ-domain-containing protein 1